MIQCLNQSDGDFSFTRDGTLCVSRVGGFWDTEREHAARTTEIWRQSLWRLCRYCRAARLDYVPASLVSGRATFPHIPILLIWVLRAWARRAE